MTVFLLLACPLIVVGWCLGRRDLAHRRKVDDAAVDVAERFVEYERGVVDLHARCRTDWGDVVRARETYAKLRGRA